MSCSSFSCCPVLSRYVLTMFRVVLCFLVLFVPFWLCLVLSWFLCSVSFFLGFVLLFLFLSPVLCSFVPLFLVLSRSFPSCLALCQCILILIVLYGCVERKRDGVPVRRVKQAREGLRAFVSRTLSTGSALTLVFATPLTVKVDIVRSSKPRIQSISLRSSTSPV